MESIGAAALILIFTYAAIRIFKERDGHALGREITARVIQNAESLGFQLVHADYQSIDGLSDFALDKDLNDDMSVNIHVMQSLSNVSTRLAVYDRGEKVYYEKVNAINCLSLETAIKLAENAAYAGRKGYGTQD
jgi:hypothetical protein